MTQLIFEGKTIAITGLPEQGRETGDSLARRCHSSLFSAIETRAIWLSPVRNFIGELMNNRVDYVILLQVNDVKYLIDAAQQINQLVDLKGEFGSGVCCCRFSYKSFLADCHIQVDFVPLKHN